MRPLLPGLFISVVLEPPCLIGFLAKKNKGKYFLRIEDTDKARSKEEFKKQIISSLAWLGIKHNGDEYIQSKNISKHVAVAEELLKKDLHINVIVLRKK